MSECNASSLPRPIECERIEVVRRFFVRYFFVSFLPFQNRADLGTFLFWQFFIAFADMDCSYARDGTFSDFSVVSSAYYFSVADNKAGQEASTPTIVAVDPYSDTTTTAFPAKDLRAAPYVEPLPLHIVEGSCFSADSSDFYSEWNTASFA